MPLKPVSYLGTFRSHWQRARIINEPGRPTTAEDKEAEAQGEKVLTAEGEANETFESEMDDFQTPLLRCGPSCAVFFTYLAVLDSLGSAEQFHSLGTSILFHSFWQRFMTFYSLNKICSKSSRPKEMRRSRLACLFCPHYHCGTLLRTVPLRLYSFTGLNSCLRLSSGGSPRGKEEKGSFWGTTACSLFALGKTYFCSTSNRADISNGCPVRCELYPGQASDRWCAHSHQGQASTPDMCRQEPSDRWRLPSN